MADENFITLEYDNGEEMECEILGVFDADGKEYIALYPQDGSEDVYIYGYKEVGEDEQEYDVSKTVMLGEWTPIKVKAGTVLEIVVGPASKALDFNLTVELN